MKMQKQISHREHRGHRESPSGFSVCAFENNGFVVVKQGKHFFLAVRRTPKMSAETFSVNSVFSVAKKGLIQ
jgi:hypothetical protein